VKWQEEIEPQGRSTARAEFDNLVCCYLIAVSVRDMLFKDTLTSLLIDTLKFSKHPHKLVKLFTGNSNKLNNLYNATANDTLICRIVGEVIARLADSDYMLKITLIENAAAVA
jgi:hypothetical protein